MLITIHFYINSELFYQYSCLNECCFCATGGMSNV